MEALDALINTSGSTGVPVLQVHETKRLQRLLAANPDLKVTPTIFLECLDFPYDADDFDGNTLSLAIPAGQPHLALREELVVLRRENERLKYLSPKSDVEVQTDGAKSQVGVVDFPRRLQPKQLHDQPPAYEQNDCDERLKKQIIASPEERYFVTADSLQAEKCVISEEDLEMWRRLKTNLGLDCEVITKFIESKSSSAHNRTRGSSAIVFKPCNPHLVCLPGREGRTMKSLLVFTAIVVSHILSWGVVFIIARPFLVLSPSTPGGATYADRLAWTSYNTIHAAGEGFVHAKDSEGVWSHLGRAKDRVNSNSNAGIWPT